MRPAQNTASSFSIKNSPALTVHKEAAISSTRVHALMKELRTRTFGSHTSVQSRQDDEHLRYLPNIKGSFEQLSVKLLNDSTTAPSIVRPITTRNVLIQENRVCVQQHQKRHFNNNLEGKQQPVILEAEASQISACGTATLTNTFHMKNMSWTC